MQQESGWNPDAKSSFAAGLAQFTPQTAQWISGVYPKDLGNDQPYNPEWAIRALVRYDRSLFLKTAPALTDCDNWAFALSAYNGGIGWVVRDRQLCDAAGSCDRRRWWGAVELHTARAPAAMKENRDYPRRILLKLQSAYNDWGVPVSCHL